MVASPGPCCTAVVVELLVSIYLVDVVSGVFHAALDYSDCGARLRHVIPKSKEAVHRTRQIDRRYEASDAWSQTIWNFQAHHYAPFPEHDDQLVETAVIATPLLLVTWLQYAVGWLAPRELRVWTFVLTLSHGVQHSHFLAHQRSHRGVSSLPPLVATLQDLGLLLHPRVHKRHHDTFDTHFCIFNGWANPLVNAGFRAASALGMVDPKLVLHEPNGLKAKEREA